MPAIISRDQIIVRGISGDGAKTGELWQRLSSEFEAHPFEHDSSCAYEIRIYGTDGSCVCHVGYAVSSGKADEPFTDYTLPASHYASFDVKVANGYDSENRNMDTWLESNPDGWVMTKDENGSSVAVEYYTKRYDNEGIVEIWIPVNK
jgi:predicted transcriptional regulator YdeE